MVGTTRIYPDFNDVVSQMTRAEVWNEAGIPLSPRNM